MSISTIYSHIPLTLVKIQAERFPQAFGAVNHLIPLSADLTDGNNVLNIQETENLD